MFSHNLENNCVIYIMKKVYVFSFEPFVVSLQNKIFNVNKNAHVELSGMQENDTIQIFQQNEPNKILTINPLKIKTNNFVRKNFCDNNLFLQIVATDFSNLIQKISIKDAEIFIYENSVRLIFQNSCYTHSYTNSFDCHAIKNDNNIYLINDKNLLIFNCINKTFNKLIIEKYLKNTEKIEFLCKIPRNFCYFLYFFINLSNNKVSIKKLKKGDFTIKERALPHSIFYLIKNGFEDSKKYLSNVDYKNLNNYFNSFEDIININNNHYLISSNQITSIIFKIENNKIIDID